MEPTEIYDRVSSEIEKWRALQRGMGWDIEISQGAIFAISFMVNNIKEDPSDYWTDINPDSMQMYAISVIPNIMNDIVNRFPKRREQRRSIRLSSWEIWHGISYALDSWCPIPKDF